LASLGNSFVGHVPLPTRHNCCTVIASYQVESLDYIVTTTTSVLTAVFHTNVGKLVLPRFLSGTALLDGAGFFYRLHVLPVTSPNHRCQGTEGRTTYYYCKLQKRVCIFL